MFVSSVDLSVFISSSDLWTSLETGHWFSHTGWRANCVAALPECLINNRHRKLVKGNYSKSHRQYVHATRRMYTHHTGFVLTPALFNVKLVYLPTALSGRLLTAAWNRLTWNPDEWQTTLLVSMPHSARMTIYSLIVWHAEDVIDGLHCDECLFLCLRRR